MRLSRFARTVWGLLGLVAVLLVGSCRDQAPTSVVAVARRAKVTPDYAEIVIPPNIAPLNFVIDEPGQKYRATIHSASGEKIDVVSDTGEIVIPRKRWKRLLSQNAGKELYVDVCVKTEDGTWRRYETISNAIAAEPIDPYLVYRFMMPSSYFPKQMRICQRSLERFDEEIVLDTASFGDGCAHCHSFVGNDSDKMLIGIRSTGFPSATVYAHDGKIDKIGTKFGYTAWHPSGRIVTYSINDVRQFFHTARGEIHDVIDMDSIIVYYDIEGHETKRIAALSDKQRLETYPAWTPDGKYLYFCSAPLLWTDTKTVPPRRYQEVKYDLMRIRYDVETDRWGSLETVLRAAETGLSILLPRISPDGRFLLFCMGRYGCFPIYQPSSDLYMMDLHTGMYRKAPVNSDFAESWHSWSSNSHWIVFSSKRQGGKFTRPFISYVDADGHARKPFVLPQRNPSFYESCYHVYSLPELIAGPVTTNREALIKTIIGSTQISVNAVTGASPKAGGAKAYIGGQGSVQ